MYNVSNEYKTSMNSKIRNPSYIRITFGIIDTAAVSSSTISSNSEDNYSNTNGIYNSLNVIDKKYAKLLPNAIILDGGILTVPPSNYAYQGYTSNYYSNEHKEFVNVPKLIIEFSEYVAFAGLTFTFDTIYNNYPTSMRILCYSDNELTETINATPDANEWVLEQQVPLNGYVNKLEIEFLSTNNSYKDVRISNMLFGIIKTFGNDDIEKAEFKREVDLISSKLPTEEFSFTIFDARNLYNPENPLGIWRYLENGQTVKADLGYEVEEGNIEWIPMCNNVISGDIKSESNGAIQKSTFKTVSILNYLEDNYNYGIYNPNGDTLYNLAEKILQSANIPLDDGGNVRWSIDEKLKNIRTLTPLPVDTKRNLLQIIANAGMCVLYTDRQGKINIKDRDFVLDSDFIYSFDNLYKTPTLNKYPALKDVIVTYTTLSVGTEVEELLKQEVSSSTAQMFEFDYDTATDVTVTTSGLTITTPAELYAQKCIIGLSGTGTITINGKRIEKQEQTYTKNYNIVGENCPVKNYLINTTDQATPYAEWVKNYAMLRNEYTIEDRGYPEIDCTDVVLADTNFSENAECIIAKSDISFNGAIKGKTKYYLKEGV